MSFQEEFIHGYKKHSKNFDKWCEKASVVLGKVTQCGILETDTDGNALIAINRPDFGESYIGNNSYILDEHLTYSLNLEEGFISQCSQTGVQFLYEYQEDIYGKKFDLWHGFVYVEEVEDGIQRQYYFGSDTPEIYNRLFNNVGLVKKLISHFKKENEHIVRYFRERKFNISDIKSDFFRYNPNQVTEKERLIGLLRTLDILDEEHSITEREYHCLKLYSRAQSASEIGKILGLSRRTVETHFVNLKNKLTIKSKAELIELLD